MRKINRGYDLLKLKMRLFIAKSRILTHFIQKYMLNSILLYAMNNVDFYRKRKTGNRNIKFFPIVSKQDIRQDYESFKSNKIDKMFFFKSYTGGSTGEPFMLYNQSIVDEYFQNRLWKKMGYRNGDKILALDGSSIDDEQLKMGIYWKKKSDKNLPYGSYALSSLYLTDKNIRVYIDYIFSFKPNFIRGYPSFIFNIAKYIYDNRIVLDFPIKGIQLTSETALDYQISTIETVFNTNVILQYGHSESAIFAYATKPNYEYYFEPLYGYFEVLDEYGNQVGENEIGEIVVTSLHNRVMPLIRYKTGDYAVMSSNHNYVKAILGRTQDYIVGREGEKVLLTALIFAQHFKALKNIIRWHIIQDQPGIIDIQIIKANEYNHNDEQEIYELFNKKGRVHSNFIYVKDIKLSKRGKSLMVTQKLEV